ncbi:hypothetical protein [Streptomyces sp. NPDC055400]
MASPPRYSLEQTTVRRTTLALLDLNQTKGFDYPGCAWPEPDPVRRHRDEYCDGRHDHAARLPERTTTGATGATATAPRSDGP